MLDSAIQSHKRHNHDTIQAPSIHPKNIAWTLPGILLTARQARAILDHEMSRRMKTVPKTQWKELYEYLSHQLDQAHADVDFWYDPHIVKMTPEMLEQIKREIGE